MRKSARAASAFAAVLSVYLAACGSPQDVSQIKSKVDEIQAQQKDVLAKLDALAKGQKEILSKAGTAAAAKPTAEAPDPNKRYDVSVGNSFTKGPADAVVTMVEWSDFQ